MEKQYKYTIIKSEKITKNTFDGVPLKGYVVS